MKDTQIQLGQGHRSIEGAVHYSLAHEVRTEILAILNEGIHSPEELSEITSELPSKLGHHIKALLDDGSIELVCVKPVRNTLQHFYGSPDVSVGHVTVTRPGRGGHNAELQHRQRDQRLR